ncbi:hypothetical protein F4775DRAFT_180942 [Biscogniauxia sp. FL1348]|nr:hypothetical protein F4775DRAFT_180942 [Biscogniauxia sp. FL1348]
MRSCYYKRAVPLFRGLHARTLSAAPAPGPVPAPALSLTLRSRPPPALSPCRCQATLVPSPRKRRFSTSHMLSSNGEKESPTPSASGSSIKAPDSTPSIAAPKRKAVRAPAAKSLRVGSKAKQTKRVSEARKTSGTGSLESDELDYRRTVTAVCVARAFDMDLVQEHLRLHGFELDPDGTGFDPQAVVHARGAGNGDLFVFPSGTVVAWSVPSETLMTLATKQLIRAAEFPHLDQIEVEKLEFTPEETRDTSYMKGEVVVLGTKAEAMDNNRLDTTLAKIAFSSGLARSPKLAVLETNLMEYLSDSETMTNVLVGGSQHKLNRGSVLKMTGQLLGLRAQLNHYSDITEELPDMFWDSEYKLEEYYNQMGTALAVRQRISILNRRIDYANENLTVLREMISETSGHRLEWIIIYLITIEVLFELRRVYREEFSEKGREEARPGVE